MITRRVAWRRQRSCHDVFAQETLAHDAAGNLTYDGRYKFAYDAWGRMVEVKRGYRNSQGALTEGSTVATIGYDGLSRRIVKDVENSGDWDCAYHYYYSGQRMIETRNGSDNVLKQHVWGLGYVDELVQIAINDDPTDAGEDDCETFYWAMQDANYNVLGIVDGGGDLAERYEYTPYGQRTVYTSAGTGTNDPQCMSPLLESKRVEVSTVKQPYGICNIGHQGLMHDKEFNWVYNRARYLAPYLGTFNRFDPLNQSFPSGGYQDGMNGFEYVSGNPIVKTDFLGLKNYKLGAKNPPHPDDPGAGAHASENPQYGICTLKKLVENVAMPWARLGMPNAAAHLRHYFKGSGAEYWIKLEDMLKNVPAARNCYEEEQKEAMQFVETLDEGEYQITSGDAIVGYNLKTESKDWYYAVGGYSSWGQGRASVKCENGMYKYKLFFTYKVYDKYNWDKGKNVTIGGVCITDDVMGKFHRQGLAREFKMYGTKVETVFWEKPVEKKQGLVGKKGLVIERSDLRPQGYR